MRHTSARRVLGVLASILAVAGCTKTTSPNLSPAALAQACASVPSFDALHQDIVRVEPFSVARSSKTPVNVPGGALVYLRATPGMTSQWLARVIECDAV